jgi:hypothetical protein
MKLASRNDIIELCVKHKRVKDGKHEMFKLSAVVMANVIGEKRW